MYNCEPCLPSNSNIFSQSLCTLWKRERFMSVNPPDVNFSEQMSGLYPAPYPIDICNPWMYNIEMNNMDSAAFPCFESGTRFCKSSKKNDKTNISMMNKIHGQGFQPQSQVGQSFIPLPVHPTRFKQGQLGSRHIPSPVHPSFFKQPSLIPPILPSSYKQKGQLNARPIPPPVPPSRYRHRDPLGLPANQPPSYKAYKYPFNNSANASRNQVCRFCLQNGEREEFYSNHQLKDHKGKVTCPILRKYVCGICKATGDGAHTISYCPFFDKKKNKKPLAVILKQTCHDSCGRTRPSFQ